MKLNQGKNKMKTKNTNENKSQRVIDSVRATCEERLTDVVAGPMTLNELRDEIFNQCVHRSPEYMIILIEKRKDLGKYHSTVYLTNGDFRNYRQYGHLNKFNMEVKK